MQQAIKLLQLSNLELADFVEGELESNPLLESEERRDSEADSPFADDEPNQEDQDSASLTASDQMPEDSQAPLDTDPQELYDEGPSDGAFGSLTRCLGHGQRAAGGRRGPGSAARRGTDSQAAPA